MSYSRLAGDRSPYWFLTLLSALVFVGACAGLWVRRGQHNWAVCYPEFWIALLSGIPLFCVALQAWFIDWRQELETASAGQLVKFILSAWGVAYGWCAITVAINAQDVGPLVPVIWLLLWSVWFICLCRLAIAVHGLAGRWCAMRWCAMRVPLTALVVLALCWLFVVALFLMIYVHFMAGGHL